MDWRFRQMLDDIDLHNQSANHAVQTGNTLRTPDGRREYWLIHRPTKKAIKAAKKLVQPYMKSSSVFCACCENWYDMPTVYSSVKKHGVCTYCLSFVNSEVEGIRVKRAPTLSEALSAPVDDIRQAEAWVMRAALLEQYFTLTKLENP